MGVTTSSSRHLDFLMSRVPSPRVVEVVTCRSKLAFPVQFPEVATVILQFPEVTTVIL